MRRVFAPALAGMAVAASLAAQTPGAVAAADSIGRLWDPSRVQQRARTTTAMNDSLVQAIEHQLRCTCGCNLDVYTCRTTDFTCATSPAMHEAVVARLDSALAAGFREAQLSASVLGRFEAQYGQSVLMAPPRRGFNWAAYLIPFVGLGVGLGLVVGLMRRWIRARPVAADGAEPAAPDGVAPEAMERLKRELEHFEA